MDGKTKVRYLPMGDQVVLVQFDDKLSEQLNERITSFTNVIADASIAGVRQIVPTFTGVAVCYDPCQLDYAGLLERLAELEPLAGGGASAHRKTLHIPVVYGERFGPDLEEVARRCGLAADEVVRLHHAKPYLVYMVGFNAGFPYCGDLHPALRLPRRSTPHLKVKKGSIAIAGEQTGLYTIESPGGWHIIGWTPMETFDAYREPPSRLVAGDCVKFVPISPAEAERWSKQSQEEWDRAWNTLK